MLKNFGIFNGAKLSFVAILMLTSTVNASELTINDVQGVPYLKVDAADGSVFDLNIVFGESKLSKDTELTLTNKTGDTKKIKVSPSDVTNGVSIQNVATGEYVVNTNSADLKIKRVNVSDTEVAKAVATEDSIGTTAYVAGAAAIVGGVAAVSAGSDSGIFGGGSNSSGNTSRNGSGTSSSGSSGSLTGSSVDPRIAPTSDFDPNFPTNNGGFDAAPDGTVTVNPAPPAANPNGGGIPAATPTPAPSALPPPPITNPMTPS